MHPGLRSKFLKIISYKSSSVSPGITVLYELTQIEIGCETPIPYAISTIALSQKLFITNDLATHLTA